MNNFEGKSVILFDGVCNLCNTSINFIIKNDKKKTVRANKNICKKLILRKKQFQIKNIIKTNPEIYTADFTANLYDFLNLIFTKLNFIAYTFNRFKKIVSYFLS